MSPFQPTICRLMGLAALSGGGAAVLWTKILIDAWPTLFLQGTICGRAGFWDHCPLCVPAVCLTAITLLAVYGLALQVLPTGGRTWVLRAAMAGKRRDMGLGGGADERSAQRR